MSMTTPIVDFVRSYAQSGTARLHMPGHKGQSLLGFEPLDITEICGADELYAPEGIIAESEANATRLFGTAHSYYSTEGSSQCIRAMLFLALQGAPQSGKRPVLLAARNAHKALLYAAALLDFDIRWLWPSAQAEGALCSCPVTAEALTGALHAMAQQGNTPLACTSPARIIWAGCRNSRRWRRSAGRRACLCWWITPTAPICAFCRRTATPSRRVRPCAATLPTRPCRWSPAARICIWRTMPLCRTSGCAGGAGAVRLYQPLLPHFAVAGCLQCGAGRGLPPAAGAVLRGAGRSAPQPE